MFKTPVDYLSRPEKLIKNFENSPLFSLGQPVNIFKAPSKAKTRSIGFSISFKPDQQIRRTLEGDTNMGKRFRRDTRAAHFIIGDNPLVNPQQFGEGRLGKASGFTDSGKPSTYLDIQRSRGR
jgi:hypothetical protein